MAPHVGDRQRGGRVLATFSGFPVFPTRLSPRSAPMSNTTRDAGEPTSAPCTRHRRSSQRFFRRAESVLTTSNDFTEKSSRKTITIVPLLMRMRCEVRSGSSRSSDRSG